MRIRTTAVLFYRLFWGEIFETNICLVCSLIFYDEDTVIYSSATHFKSDRQTASKSNLLSGTEQGEYSVPIVLSLPKQFSHVQPSVSAPLHYLILIVVGCVSFFLKKTAAYLCLNNTNILSFFHYCHLYVGTCPARSIVA